MPQIEDPIAETPADPAEPTGRSWSGWIAAALVLALVGWMASGMMGGEAPVVVEARRAEEPQPVAVEATRSLARPITRALSIEGEVDPRLATPVRAEAGGVVDEVVAARGRLIAAGDVIARIAPAEREAQLGQARADLRRAQRDFDAVSELAERGFATRAREEEVRSALAASEARLAEAEAAIADTVVSAPASGVLNDVLVDPGEVVQAGAEVARIVDTSTLVVKVRIPQRSIADVEAGQVAMVSFVTGQMREGRVTYVSANAEAATRTFAVEIEVANPNGDVPAGISAEVSLPINEVPAHFVSPAILSLGADGALGVKTVEAGDTVAFYPVELVRAQTDGIWVSGLPEEATIITVGQGFVARGETVAVTLAEPASAPAATEAPDPAPGTTVETAPMAAARQAPSGADATMQVPVTVVAEPMAAPGPSPAATVSAGDRTWASDERGRAEPADVQAPTSARVEPARVPVEPQTAEPASPRSEAMPAPVAVGAAENPGVGVALPSSVSAFAQALADDPESAIRTVQERLNALGFEVGVPTGEANARTRLALAQFQEANGLETTGELGPDVLAALTAADSAATAPAEGGASVETEATSTEADPDIGPLAVGNVQRALRAAGFDPGAIDGLRGPGTRAAVEAYQRARGLAVTGRIDFQLLASLGVSTGASR